MKTALRTYSDILQLRTATIQALLDSPRGIAFALKMFLIIALIAGLGVWFGLPKSLSEPTTVELVDRGIAAASQAGASLLAAINPDLTPGNFGARLGEVAANIQQRTQPATSVLSAVAAWLTGRAPAAEAAPGQGRATEQQSAANLQRLLALLSIAPEQFDQLLAQLGTTRAQVADVLQQLAVTPARVGAVLNQIGAVPDQLSALAQQVHSEAVKTEPPLGERPSRMVRTAGAWLATPFQFAADWALFALVLLLAAKSLGGRGALPQHIGAVALASAPAVLLFSNYLPNITGLSGLSGGLPVPTAVALNSFAQLLSLLGLIWCFLVLLKAVGVAHGFGWWKSLGTVVLAWVALYVAVPVFTFLASMYLIRS